MANELAVARALLGPTPVGWAGTTPGHDRGIDAEAAVATEAGRTEGVPMQMAIGVAEEVFALSSTQRRSLFPQATMVLPIAGYQVTIEPSEEGGYIIHCPTLRASGQAEALDEALDEAEQMVLVTLDVIRERGLDRPPPDDTAA